MKAVILEGINQPLKYTDAVVPDAGPGEVLIQVKAAAFNHRDLWIQKGLYGGLRFPSIQGSDGCGTVIEVGEGVDEQWLNQEVVMNPSLNWGADPRVQGKDYMILGMAQDGTFAEYVKVPIGLVHKKPAHLTAEEAAAFPLAGLTGFRALMTRAAAKQGETVLVTGAGGGVALFCVQFALALGCNVFVTSGEDDKIDKVVALGAKGGVNYKNENWHKELQAMSGGFDVIIDSSGGETFARLVDSCKPAGRIAMYGATLGAFNSGVPAKIFWKQISLFGSTMGNNEEFAQMVSFIDRHKIKPIIDKIFPLPDAQEAIERMSRGEQFGKVILKVS